MPLQLRTHDTLLTRVRNPVTRRIAVLLAALFTGSFAATPRLLAQATPLRGVVRDSASGAPLGGAVVTALDSSGASPSRTIAGADGRFVLVDASHVARLRVIRIGFRPRDLDVPRDRAAVMQILMERQPPMLEAVRVSDDELCPGSADRGAAFQLWEQARAGLLATVVAREAKPATTTALTFEQTLSPSDEQVRKVLTRTVRERTTRPFSAAASASFFALHGYMAEDASAARVYNAPDADVLLDESFAATHCFRRQAPDAEHRAQTGVAFTPVPARGRDTLVDVSGVIWLDDSVPQVRSLDFRYTALEPAAVAAGAGGHLEFRAMPNGVSFVERWQLRLPVLELRPAGANDPFGRQRARPQPSDRRGDRRADRNDLRVAEIVQSGGVVLAAEWSDGTLWRDTPTGVRGRVTEPGGARPVANAVVSLVGTSTSTVSAADGSFSLSPVVPGRYTLTALDTALNDFVPPRTNERSVRVLPGRFADAAIELAPAAAGIARLCRDTRASDRTTTIVGRIVTTDPRLHGATVRARWFADADLSAGGAVVRNAEQTIDVDDRGRFTVCGVPRERRVELSLQWRRITFADTVFHAATAAIHPLTWNAAPRP